MKLTKLTPYERKIILEIIYWIIMITLLITFLILSGFSKIFLGFLILILVIFRASITNYPWANKFWGDVSVALMGGLIVSLLRDYSMNSFNNQLIAMYIMGFITAIVLLVMGAIRYKKESANSK